MKGRPSPRPAAADARARGDRSGRIGYRDRNGAKGTIMADHKHGSMDTSVQQKTFDGFITWSVRIAAVSVGILVFLAVFNS
jgi:hypothetical protein